MTHGGHDGVEVRRAARRATKRRIFTLVPQSSMRPPAFGLMGVGLGLASTASTAVGTEAAPAAHRGVASGLLTATAQIGTALGLALVAPLVAVGEAGPAGMRCGFAAAVIAVVGLAGSRLLPTSGRPAGLVDAGAKR